MYNEEIKEQFFATFPEKSQYRTRTRLESISTAEQNLGKDLTEFSDEDLRKWFSGFNWISSDAVRSCIADFGRYNRWAHSTNQGFQFTDAIERLDIRKDIDFTRGIRALWLGSPDSLVSTVTRVYPIDEGYVALPALIFAWLGFTAGEAAQIASKQVDCAQRRVFMPSGALYPYPIPEVFWEPLEVYAKTVASERESNSSRKVYADDLGFFLRRMITEESKKSGEPYTSGLISSSITNFSRQYEKRFHERIRFSYVTIIQSGRYYRLYQSELSGVNLYAKENKELVCELGKGKMAGDVLTIYEAYRAVFYPRS